MKNKPELVETAGILNACGKEIKMLGEALFTLKLSEFIGDHKIIVPEIDDECLLGVDVLMSCVTNRIVLLKYF